MEIISKYSGKCRCCHQPIIIGERINWLPNFGAMHLNCEINGVKGMSDKELQQKILECRSKGIEWSEQFYRETNTLWYPIQVKEEIVEQTILENNELTDGMYQKDGIIYKVQHAVHNTGRLYAKKLTILSNGKGKFVYEQGAIRTLTIKDRMSLSEAKKFGSVYGFCCHCLRTLTNEKSIALGIGPICRGSFIKDEDIDESFEISI